ncbi:hypothetical protein SSX86_009630 [Deinandra increscens subsp. villosa]|uniref:Uncharacterized protein n=1 Tax=Deinandra increscens subsp. villosa TaxID=3103831 RepID=A0AAP0DE03_9ASTR
MSPGSCSTPYGVRTFATLLIRHYRASSKTTANTPDYQHTRGDMRLSKFGYGISGSTHHALSISSCGSVKRLESKIEHETKVNGSTIGPKSFKETNNFSWVKWVLGSMLPLIFSFWKQKWDSLLKLEGKQIYTNLVLHFFFFPCCKNIKMMIILISGKVEEVVEEAEEAAEVVEKVASTTEKLSAEVAEKLENGKLKEVALTVEHVSNVIAKDARMTEDFIRKVGDLKQDLADLEAMVEPVIDKMEHKK